MIRTNLTFLENSSLYQNSTSLAVCCVSIGTTSFHLFDHFQIINE